MDSESKAKSTPIGGEDNNDDEIMLYDDLTNAKIPAVASIKSTVKPTGFSQSLTSNDNKPKSFTEQVVELQSQVESLSNENQRLRRNIGTLFRTARSEIQRKDAEISRLMEELDETRQQQQGQR